MENVRQRICHSFLYSRDEKVKPAVVVIVQPGHFGIVNHRKFGGYEDETTGPIIFVKVYIVSPVGLLPRYDQVGPPIVVEVAPSQPLPRKAAQPGKTRINLGKMKRPIISENSSRGQTVRSHTAQCQVQISVQI